MVLRGSGLHTFDGRKVEMISLSCEVLLAASDRWILSDVPLAGVDSRWSRSMGVEAIVAVW